MIKSSRYLEFNAKSLCGLFLILITFKAKLAKGQCPFSSSSNTQNQNQWKPADEGTEREVWRYLRERGDTTFLFVLAQNFALNLSSTTKYKINFDNCIKTAFNSRQYARCLLPLMQRRLRQEKLKRLIKSRRKKKNNILLRDSLIQENSPNSDEPKIIQKLGKWSDMTLPAANAQPILMNANDTSKNLANFLSNLVKSIKNITGPWAVMPDLDLRLNESKNLKHASKLTAMTKQDTIFHTLIKNIMEAPLFLMKDSIETNEQKPIRKIRSSQDNIDILSPRLLSIADSDRLNRPSFLSPSFLSLTESPNNIASIPQLLSALPRDQKLAWMTFFLEVTGTADYMRFIETDKFQKLLDMGSVTWYGNKTIPYKKLFEAKDSCRTVGQLFQTLSPGQFDEINRRGFSFLDETQMKGVYRHKLNDPNFMPFDMNEYFRMDELQKEELLIDLVDTMANIDYQTESSFVTDSPTEPLRKKRRSAVVLPCFNAPFINGFFAQAALLAPAIQCPSIFSYAILGPIVLSPTILAPYILAPGVLDPSVLAPLILSPYALGPTVLGPIVLTPTILSPFILSPAMVSPSVLSPNILSPFVLSPNVLSPAVLSSDYLSPGLLSPDILSPSDGTPDILSPCILCGDMEDEEPVVEPGEGRHGGGGGGHHR